MFRMFIYTGFCFVIAVPWMIGVKVIHDTIFGDLTVTSKKSQQ